MAGATAVRTPGKRSHMPGSAEVIYLDSAKVAAAFAKGAPLVDNDEVMMHAHRNYKVHASRREAPGVAEIHTRDTDIVYVLDGSATFVTGGMAVNTRTIAPEELRGTEIRGGQSYHLVKGDVIIVPNGVAHWFQEVKGPFTYYVVKVRSASGDAS